MNTETALRKSVGDAMDDVGLLHSERIDAAMRAIAQAQLTDPANYTVAGFNLRQWWRDRGVEL